VEQNFARMNRRQFFGLHILMVVYNFHGIGVAILPPEANPPLVINTDAVLSSPSALQGFQPIARRQPQVD
jgi:hypothetical protein